MMHAELWEIDENLIRSDLSPAEEAQHLTRRRELWGELKKGETGQSLASLGGRGHKEFAADTAAKTGITKQDINRKISRAEALGDDIKMGSHSWRLGMTKSLTSHDKLAMPLNIGKCNRRKGKTSPVFSCRRVRQPTQRKFSDKLNGKQTDDGPTKEWLAKRRAILGSDIATGELDDPLSTLLARGLISEHHKAAADTHRRLYVATNGTPYTVARALERRGGGVSSGPSEGLEKAYKRQRESIIQAIGEDGFTHLFRPLLIDRAWPSWLDAAVNGKAARQLETLKTGLAAIGSYTHERD